jgi:hypothetical protein
VRMVFRRSHGSVPFRADSVKGTLAGIRAGAENAVRLRSRGLRVCDPNRANGVSRIALVWKRSRGLMVARAHVQGLSRGLMVARAHVQGLSRDLMVARAHVQGLSRGLMVDPTHARAPVLTTAGPGQRVCVSHCHDRKPRRACTQISSSQLSGQAGGRAGRIPANGSSSQTARKLHAQDPWCHPATRQSGFVKSRSSAATRIYRHR